MVVLTELPSLHEIATKLLDHIDTVLAILALGFAARQYVDAREHTRNLKAASESMHEDAGKLAANVTTVNTSVNQIGQEAAKLGETIASLTKDTATITGSVGALGKSVDGLRAQSEFIREAVLTLPPRTFVRDFCQQVTNIRAVLLSPIASPEGQGRLTRADLEGMIRVLLGVVARLAASYDTRPARYAANVMLFLPRSRNSPPYFPKFDDDAVLKFLPAYYDPKYLRGLLFLPRALSAIGTAEGAADPALEEVILGIPEEKYQKNNGCWAVLPGAPMAFIRWNDSVRLSDTPALRDAVHGIDDILELAKLSNGQIGGQEFRIDAAVVERVEKYYREAAPGQAVRSFQAFPLVDNDGTRRAFGVMNIHCDRPIFLGAAAAEGRLRQETFADIVSPIVFDVAEAVKLWWAKAGQDYADD